MGKGSYGIDFDAVSSIAGEIRDVARLGVEIGVVAFIMGVEHGGRDDAR